MKAKLLDKEGCVYRGGGKAQELEGTARAAACVQCLIFETSDVSEAWYTFMWVRNGTLTK